MTDLHKFSKKYTHLFHTAEYIEYLKMLDIKAFHEGGCFMVAYSLEKVLGGNIYGIASRAYGYRNGFANPLLTNPFWNLEHYIIEVNNWFIDNTGIYNWEEINKKEQEYLETAEYNAYHVAPIDSEWPEPLFEGYHIFDDYIFRKLIRDAEDIKQHCS